MRILTLLISNHLTTVSNFTVSAVLLSRTGIEMFGIYTSRIVAFMANKQSFRDGAFRNLVHVSMRFNHLSIRSAGINNAIAVFIFTSSPKPAAFCFTNIRPEPRFESDRLTHSTYSSFYGRIVKEIA